MSKTKSEDVLGVKWDRCLADTSIKMLGGQFSTLFASVIQIPLRSDSGLCLLSPLV